MKRKLGFSLCGLIIVFFLAIIAYNIFNSFKPEITFQRFRMDIEENYNFDVSRMMMSYNEQWPLPASFMDNQNAYVDWNHEIFDELYYDCMAPTDVKLSAVIDNSKVTFTYQGYITTKQGETMDYFEEATFDFHVHPELKNFDDVIE